jgi:glutamine cyclotransferase
MKPVPAEIVHEHGPFPGVDAVHGLTWDGKRIWFAAGDRLHTLDPDSGEVGPAIRATADAGTAFDGRYLYQIAGDRIHKLDPATGRVLAEIPAPGHGSDSGLAWAEGSLWVGEYRERKIHQVDPQTGAVLRTMESNRFVTGVTWVEGELWHATWEGEQSELRQLDPRTGKVLEQLAMPPGEVVSGLDCDGERFYCGGGSSAKVRVVRRPRRAAAG